MLPPDESRLTALCTPRSTSRRSCETCSIRLYVHLCIYFVSELFKMVNVVGKYQHERNENIDEYFKSLGVPYLARKMMAVSHPTLEITREGDTWTIKNVTLMSTQVVTFTLGTEYAEVMPSGDKLRSVTILEGDTLTVTSRTNDENKVVRRYEFTEDEVILTMTQEKSEQVARRFYKRLA